MITVLVANNRKQVCWILPEEELNKNIDKYLADQNRHESIAIKFCDGVTITFKFIAISEEPGIKNVRVIFADILS